MPVVGVRELSRRVTQLITEVETTREPAVITRHGRPVVAILPLDEASFEDFVLAHAPEFVKGMAEAEKEYAAGKTHTLDEVLAEVERAER